MNSVPSSTLTLRETHDPEGQAWMLLSTNAVDHIGSGPHPNRRVDVGEDELTMSNAVGGVDDDLDLTNEDFFSWRVDDDVDEALREGVTKPKVSRVAMRPTMKRGEYGMNFMVLSEREVRTSW